MRASSSAWSAASDSALKRIARRYLPEKTIGLLSHLRDGTLLQRHARASFSQEGEDLVLLRLLEGSGPGFYVDIGAHHPTRFSNTYLLYKAGWHGINIDATPGSMRAFDKLRPRDINLEVAIATGSKDERIYLMSDPALNSLSRSLSSERAANTAYDVTGYRDVKSEPLRQVLQHNLPEGVDIAVMDIDTEGFDLQVLQSNDWERFRPYVLLIEILHKSLRQLLFSPEVTFLEDRGYTLYAKLHNTVIFVEKTWGEQRINQTS